MKLGKTHTKSLIGTLAMMVAIGLFIPAQSAAADEPASVCQTNGTYPSSDSGDAALTTSDLSKVSGANDWLTGQLQTSTDVVTTSTITPDQIYDPSDQGAVSGTFVLQGRSYSTENPESLTITSPSPLADSYRGVVQGHVLVTPTANRWIVQAYKRTSSRTGTGGRPGPCRWNHR